MFYNLQKVLFLILSFEIRLISKLDLMPTIKLIQGWWKDLALEKVFLESIHWFVYKKQ